MSSASAIRSFSSRYGGVINWFPGHMFKTAAELLNKIKATDVIFEVRDARAPFSCANPVLDNMCAGKPRVIILNKADLAGSELRQRITNVFVKNGDRCIFTTAKKGLHVSKLFEAADAVHAKADDFRIAGKTMLILGLPNTGKSTLINALRNKADFIAKKGAKTGASPGITRSIGLFQVREKPPMFVFDSPGVMLPKIQHVEIGMRLTLINCLPDTVVPFPVQAEYLLFYFNTIGSTRFQKALGLSSAYTEEIIEKMLLELCSKHGFSRPDGEADVDAAARYFVRAFQRGDFGNFVLDPVP